MRMLLLVLAVMLPGCMLGLFSRQVPVEGDKSIVLPRFFEHDAIEVGATNEPYRLDGETLRALVVAANDYLPPGIGAPPCPSAQEAQFYRVIRQGDIIFVYIHENHEYCGRSYPVRHSGAKYAISRDGRILRRIIGEQPDGPIEVATPEDGGAGFVAEPGVSPTFEATWNKGSGSSAHASTDGGTSSPAHSLPEEAVQVQFPLDLPAETRAALAGDVATAMQLALDDFLPLDTRPHEGATPEEACMHRRSSYDVIASPGPEGVMFVRITLRPEVCEPTGPVLDVEATYAVDVKAWRILAVQQ